MNDDEDIETFLNRLKLADKYLDTFLSHGYTTVKLCQDLNEDDLKMIGVKPPGNCILVNR